MTFGGKPVTMQVTTGDGGQKTVTLVPTTAPIGNKAINIPKGIIPADPSLPRVMVVSRQQHQPSATIGESLLLVLINGGNFYLSVPKSKEFSQVPTQFAL